MTDRVSGFTVTLAESIRDDDAEGIRQAISQLRGVIDCRFVIDSPEIWMGVMQERKRMMEGISEVMMNVKDSRG